jgi:cardiolipin synthase A/B
MRAAGAPHANEVRSPARLLADQALSRAAGAPLVLHNHVRLLRDAAENYPAWLDGIASARHHIYFESYIIHEDAEGYRFADALATKARDGVRVLLLYDWLGAVGKTSRFFWRRLRQAGVEVRVFNPPHVTSSFGWISRDHRKVLSVDERIAFVTGLCIGEMWTGDSARGRAPWRDTGVEVRGPAVADVEVAFASAWATAGDPIPVETLPRRESLPPAGSVSLRVIATEPSTGGLYRLDTLVAALARRSLWLTDAYFVASTSYVQALVAAARDGVDVRMLVPGSSDIPLVSALSRAGYRPLLEGGVRVFEWNGTMLHAKTAVADAHWARVGSTNLNPASWMGNWELDVAIEDDLFAKEVEGMFLRDLQHSTEIVLSRRARVVVTGQPEPRSSRPQVGRGSAGRAVAGAIGIGSAVGAAMTERRALGSAEARILLAAGALLGLLAVTAFFFPRVLALPVALIGAWTAVGLLIRAYKLRVQAPSSRSTPTRTA